MNKVLGTAMVDEHANEWRYGGIRYTNEYFHIEAHM